MSRLSPSAAGDGAGPGAPTKNDPPIPGNDEWFILEVWPDYCFVQVFIYGEKSATAKKGGCTKCTYDSPDCGVWDTDGIVICCTNARNPEGKCKYYDVTGKVWGPLCTGLIGSNATCKKKTCTPFLDCLGPVNPSGSDTFSLAVAEEECAKHPHPEEE